MAQNALIACLVVVVAAQYVVAFRTKRVHTQRMAAVATSASGEHLNPVKTTYIDEGKTVQAFETTSGLDFITHLYKAAVHAPKEIADEVDGYMTELFQTADWAQIVTDPGWKPTKAQKGEQFNRMFAVKLSKGGVLLYSPININAPGVRESVAEMGEVKVIVCPCDGHYIFAYPWQLAFPEAKVYAPSGFSLRKKCAFANGTSVNPVACGAGGEAPMELGGYLGPRALWASKGPLVTHWSEMSVPVGRNNPGLPEELADDFEVLHFSGDATSHELLFYHKHTKSLLAADFLYVGKALTMKEDWTWNTEAKLFATVMGYRSRSPAMPLYRTLKSALTAANLMVQFSSQAGDADHDIFREMVNNDAKGTLLDIPAGALGYYNDWAQMREVVSMLESMEIRHMLLCHASSYPEGEFAKKILKASWGFLFEDIKPEPRCCCVENELLEGSKGTCEGFEWEDTNWRGNCPAVCGVDVGNLSHPFERCPKGPHNPFGKTLTHRVRHGCGELAW